MSDVDDDLATDDEENHEARLGYREARDLVKEARVARGFRPVVILVAARVEEDGKRLSWPHQEGERQRTLRISSRWPIEFANLFSSVGSPDQWARESPTMDDGSSSPKMRNLGAYACGAWTWTIPDSSPVLRSVQIIWTTRCVWTSCAMLGITLTTRCVWIKISPDQGEDECEVHAAFLVESECFGVHDCVVQPSHLGALKVQRLCSPRFMKMIHESQMLILVVAGLSILEMVLRQRLLHCPDSQFEMWLLVVLGSLRTCSLINQNRLH